MTFLDVDVRERGREDIAAVFPTCGMRFPRDSRSIDREKESEKKSRKGRGRDEEAKRCTRHEPLAKRRQPAFFLLAASLFPSLCLSLSLSLSSRSRSTSLLGFSLPSRFVALTNFCPTNREEHSISCKELFLSLRFPEEHREELEGEA